MDWSSLNPFKAFGEAAAQAYIKRTERKMAQEAASAKLKQSKVDGTHQVTFNDQQLEQLMVKGQDKTWKDEYTLVSVISILNLLVVGGLAAGFGYPQVLDGLDKSMTAMAEQGVNIGLLLTTAVGAGLGVSIYRMLKL